ncbi:T9SS type A sorting domain-containing protein [Gillisia sp. JM1]|uniref:T9SS type A sorting domain-containing protein n=1 Tax=Gillisia sp. JM1 TaxID=1283286 RepID=UPI0003F9994F|nr:T9SS type A sorting domain-containing protein [Gillisia sp. JM1]
MVKKYFLTYSLNNLKCTQHFLCILFFLFVFSFSGVVYGQSISQPTVSGTPVCGGSSIEVTFTVTNGNGNGNSFTNKTTYDVYDSTISGGGEVLTGSFTGYSVGASGTVTLTVPIPNDRTLYPSNSDYQIRVESSKPKASSIYSEQFTVNNDPTPTPNASNNGPICIGGDLILNASNISGASYNWTGPNNFTSNLQNPTVSNFNSSNSGDYLVTATVNACMSETGTTNVVLITSNTWTGAQDSNWNIVNNWSCNIIPNATLDVLIPSGVVNFPLLNTGAAGECKNLTISSGTSLRVLDNTLNISGTVSNNGTFDLENGTIGLLGNNPQTILANTFVSNKIRNLIINNTSGVSLSGILEISGYLKATNGNLNTGGNLTLISDVTQTALIDGSGNGNILGAVKMQRYLDAAYGYKYFSSPFGNSTVGDFSSYVDLSATFPQVYYYDENSTDLNNTDNNTNDITGWKPYTTAASGLGSLEGYAFNFGPDANAVTVELSGNINNGDFTRQLSNNNGTYTKGFNLVGNPYPSPIDWNASGWTKTNIDNGIYFFSASSQYKGTYTSFVNNVSSTDGGSSSIIPSMQGFFVHVTDGGDNTSVTNGTLALTNEVRVNDFTQQFIKKAEPAPVSLIRLSAGIKGNSKKDAMVIYFEHFSKEVFEKDMDALKLMNTDERVPNLYSITSESDKLSINALPESFKNTNQRIPLGILSEMDGEMSIQLKDIKNLPSNFNVYLIDEVKRIGQNLSDKPEYHFNIKVGENNSRFYLIFSEYELSDPALAYDEPFSVKIIDGKVYVKLNLKNGGSGTLMATTITGQLLEVNKVTGNETISLDGIKSSGIYIINLSWKDQHFSKKIMIQK